MIDEYKILLNANAINKILLKLTTKYVLKRSEINKMVFIV